MRVAQPALAARMAASSLGIMPPAAAPLAISARRFGRREARERALVGVEHGVDVREEDEAVGVQRGGDLAGGGVGVGVQELRRREPLVSIAIGATTGR